MLAFWIVCVQDCKVSGISLIGSDVKLTPQVTGLSNGFGKYLFRYLYCNMRAIHSQASKYVKIVQLGNILEPQVTMMWLNLYVRSIHMEIRSHRVSLCRDLSVWDCRNTQCTQLVCRCKNMEGRISVLKLESCLIEYIGPQSLELSAEPTCSKETVNCIFLHLINGIYAGF